MLELWAVCTLGTVMNIEWTVGFSLESRQGMYRQGGFEGCGLWREEQAVLKSLCKSVGHRPGPETA